MIKNIWNWTFDYVSFVNFLIVFNRDEIDHDLMKECFIREFQSLVRMYDVKKINSVYFGGGKRTS